MRLLERLLYRWPCNQARVYRIDYYTRWCWRPTELFIDMSRGLFICLRGKEALRKQLQVVRQRSIRQYMKCKPENEIQHFIAENTEIVKGQSLTPEISLRLFTVKCRFWTERPEFWPFSDPFWAIYWPGGQALTRYLLNNPELSVGRRVLDLGCGCGASAIAAKLSGAAHVVASDIDPMAAIATKMNCELNGLKPFPCVTENLIGSEPENWDLILLGDMFYDETLTDSLHTWLYKCVKLHRTKILIGDPGRAQFESHDIRTLLYELAWFELPEAVREENYGLTSSSVWCYRPDY